jgi:hypothetical protein
MVWSAVQSLDFLKGGDFLRELSGCQLFSQILTHGLKSVRVPHQTASKLNKSTEEVTSWSQRICDAMFTVTNEQTGTTIMNFLNMSILSLDSNEHSNKTNID